MRIPSALYDRGVFIRRPGETFVALGTVKVIDGLRMIRVARVLSTRPLDIGPVVQIELTAEDDKRLKHWANARAPGPET